jgi:AGZA family xanthine/uracil permease-like MFS transporter
MLNGHGMRVVMGCLPLIHSGMSLLLQGTEKSMLEKLFKLSEHNTCVRTELLAGITTFLTMAYVIFVNPSILAQTGMDQGAVFVATCLAAAFGCFIWAVCQLSVAQAPGWG